VIDAAREAADAGAVVIVITHRPMISERADAVLEIAVRASRTHDEPAVLHG
jgi:ATP-binding cassette subfamily C protein CydD